MHCLETNIVYVIRSNISIRRYFRTSRVYQIFKAHILSRDVNAPTKFMNSVNINIFRKLQALKSRRNSTTSFLWVFEMQTRFYGTRHVFITCVNIIKIHSYMKLLWLREKCIEWKKAISCIRKSRLIKKKKLFCKQ